MPRNVSIERVRNLGIMAHIDAGKTTLSERVLYYTGRIHRMGDVHEGTTRLDHMVQEKQKGITITAAATSAPWTVRDGLFEGAEHQLALIDTPGHVDFTIEVERSLRVLDGAVAVVDGSQGVEPQSETVWRQADRYEVPRIAFINKMDKVGADFAMSVRSIVERLGADALPVQLPLGEGAEHRGVVDLLRRVAYVFEGDATGRTWETVPVPAEMIPAMEAARARLVERCAELDATLTDRYLAEGAEALTVPELERALRLGTLRRAVVPVLCGSAYKKRGVQMLLDAVVKYLPSPADVRAVVGTSPDGASVQRAPSDDEPLCALAFKLVTDRAAGTLTFVRVYSGRLLPGMQVWNAARNRKERVGRLVRMHATEQTDVECAYAGDIVAAIGLRDVRTGDTLAAPDAPVALGSITVPEAVVTLAIEAKSAGETDRLTAALVRMTVEDPSLRVGVDDETGQTLLRGVGELHLEIVVDRLRTEHKVEARTGRPRVAFREALRGSARVDHRLARQNGGVGLFAHVVLEVSPADRDAGLIFEDATRGGVITAEFANAVRRGVAGAMAKGLRGGRPVVDARVRLVDGGMHSVDSSAMAFELAGSMAFQEAALEAGLVVLEPVMAVEVITPEEHLGAALGTIQSRRGTVRDLSARGNASVVEADVPLAALFGYVEDLRGRTHGRASATMRFARYEAVPAAAEREALTAA
jgi:elongation factor G